MVVNRFGPRQQEELAAMLRKSLFSIFVDETTDVSAMKSLAVTVRFYGGHKVISRFLCLLECPDATADGIFNASVMMGWKSGLKAKNEICHSKYICNGMYLSQFGSL